MNITTEFTADNLTIFGGYSNIFSFFKKAKVLEKLDRFISIKKRKRLYEKLDYIKLLLTMITCGFKNMNQCCLFDHDTFIMKLLGIPSIPHASNLSRFIKSFTFKHCQQIIEVKRALMKRFHRIAFHLKHLTLDVDSTVITLCGHQEGAAEGYNDKHRGNPCYH